MRRFEDQCSRLQVRGCKMAFSSMLSGFDDMGYDVDYTLA